VSDLDAAGDGPPASDDGALPLDAAIEALGLAATARRAAYALKALHPDVVFTSGRRDKSSQAAAMASNVVINRSWIRQTYVDTPASRACQKWVDEHPDAATREALHVGLLSVLEDLADADLGRLSRHLSGEAFDVRPVPGEIGDAIKADIRSLDGLTRFLEKEGGLVRWHAQF
jgi:hypothetical protein